jgi:spermidine/putrescine transport system substrate-binding protein
MSGRLSLLTWPDYIDPRTLRQFEAEFDARIELEMVPSAVELIERMKTGNGTQDVLVPPDYAVRELGNLGLLNILDHGRLPNLGQIEARFRYGRSHDPENHVSVIKDWGTTGFMVRSDLVDGSPQTWVDFWLLAEKFCGRVTVLDSPGEVIGAALIMRGYSYNDTSPEALAGAREDLLKLKRNLYSFETNYKPLLASGKVCLALGWNGDALALKAQGVSVRYILPAEGSQIWEDDWAIAAQTQNPLLAHTFLNFVLRPEIAAQEARYTRYATGNQAALAILDDELRLDEAIYPSDHLLRNLEPGLPLDPEGYERRQALWNEIRG